MENESKHTPGPWTVVHEDEGSCFVDTVAPGNSQWAIAVPRGPNSKANARLIAAAPELLEALIECGEWFGLTKCPLDQWEDLAEVFYKDTGFLRPGKDYPAGHGLSEAEESERDAKWKAWSEKRRSEMTARIRAAIAKAEGRE